MAKTVVITSCWQCPFCDKDTDEDGCIGTPYCTHPSTNIFSREYKARYVPPIGIHPDCTLEEAPEPLDII